MDLGEKIRLARLEKRMTQSEVASDKITRNMLSAIESGKAKPSLDTLIYVAERLELPLYYLLSDDIDESEYKRTSLMPTIKDAFRNKQYAACIVHAEKMPEIDDELAYILAYSHFELGIAASGNGAFVTADKHLTLAQKYAEQTIYNTANMQYRIPLYLAFGRNVNAPLLDFDMDAYYNAMSEEADLDFFKYVCNDLSHPFSNPLLKKHALAKTRIRERKYYEAIEILNEITDKKADFEHNAYLMYCVYSDLEGCYKQIMDFENAYKYASKRMSMLEGFNS